MITAAAAATTQNPTIFPTLVVHNINRILSAQRERKKRKKLSSKRKINMRAWKNNIECGGLA